MPFMAMNPFFFNFYKNYFKSASIEIFIKRLFDISDILYKVKI